MKYLYIVVAVLMAAFALLYPRTAYEQDSQVDTPPDEPPLRLVSHHVEMLEIPEQKVEEQSTPMNRKKIIEHITNIAAKYGIDPDQFLAVARCESNLIPTAVGDNGTSHGLWQIHRPAHPSVSVAFARDVIKSTEWSAKKWVIDPTIWTCYRKLYE